MALKGETPMPMLDFPKVILSTTSKVSKNGHSQIINYCRIAGRRVTEVITDLGNGNKGVREIFYDRIGVNPERIVDRVAGRCEIYTSAAPERPYSVKQEIDGIISYLPNVTLEKLADV